jgi:PAS domain S-box-containing protein
MTTPAERDAEAIALFKHRNRLLDTIRKHSLLDPELQSYGSIFQQCCTILSEALGCCSVWAGDFDYTESTLRTFASSPPSPRLKPFIEQLFSPDPEKIIRASRLASTAPFTVELSSNLRGLSDNSSFQSITLQSVAYQQQEYGFVVICSSETWHNSPLYREFVDHVIEDIGLALFSQDTALKLKIERDFNKDIVDTIQALMVTIHPCGTILSFNRRAEEVTGYLEQEIVDKYWVDVLITPQERLEYQQLFSESLKRPHASINFTAPLLTRDGIRRYINWHGSIRTNIEKGQVGMVMLGIDETETLATGQQLHRLTARWEKIFIAIQDPALVVSNDNVILEANPATCSAAKKRRDQVIGSTVCDILHGGHGDNTACPLEQFIGYQKTRISETELHGLHGLYMLTVTPLIEENGETNSTLLLARNLTEEEVVRAEAVRAAQLAAIGELASGIAHEINNPINGIINYAQILLDDPDDPETGDNLQNIISEGKRIAGIVSNLLDFARRRTEALAPSHVDKIVTNSLQLVIHLLKKDGISCTIDIGAELPELLCNEQQLQQVVLNMISNARYALNKRYALPCPEKKIEITGKMHREGNTAMIRLTFTDYGVGIPAEIRDRIFDPFFSTKPKGEGTGLGLSISHGLIRDHNGKICVRSKIGEWTSFIIDLPLLTPHR